MNAQECFSLFLFFLFLSKHLNAFFHECFRFLTQLLDRNSLTLLSFPPLSLTFLLLVTCLNDDSCRKSAPEIIENETSQPNTDTIHRHFLIFLHIFFPSFPSSFFKPNFLSKQMLSVNVFCTMFATAKKKHRHISVLMCLLLHSISSSSVAFYPDQTVL